MLADGEAVCIDGPHACQAARGRDPWWDGEEAVGVGKPKRVARGFGTEGQEGGARGGGGERKSQRLSTVVGGQAEEEDVDQGEGVGPTREKDCC